VFLLATHTVKKVSLFWKVNKPE